MSGDHSFHLRLEVNSMTLRFAPVVGRRTVFIVLQVGPWKWWLMRWDTERAPDNRFKTADGLMGWTWSTTKRLPTGQHSSAVLST